MTIKCGHCNRYHETKDDVRACMNGEVVEGRLPSLSSATRATEKQVTYLNKIRAERGQEPVTADSMTRIEASVAITAALSTPKAARVIAETYLKSEQDGERIGKDLPDIAAGHYAVTSYTGRNDLDFFRVDRPTEGRWAGRIFVKRIGKPEISLRRIEATNALEAIEKEGVEAAGIKYGQEIGRCMKCNCHLADELSRQLGIGPDCRSNREN
jgi:hypothetical protein